ncbi:hypothetical protein VNI00_010797 [Paramarasmius palmivorus]|uniref:DUF6535 domain-containing protein n=1 Tax=Paramarasmius palmivorus TaxID=297713 RepID=A0AAW0CHL3_9AGAR
MPENPPEAVTAEEKSEPKKPTVDQSFEKLLTVVAKYDEELAKGWRDDIDTLLVFGGLFSAVVTAFLIESYQKLEEDPADKTVILLEQLVSSQRNASYVPDPIPPFQPNASTIRINCFWLLSLIFSLTSALFGLLCKQWIREFQRETPTRTPAEALALRQLRRDSFYSWKVPAILAALPILLEIALLFFFVGILDLLWGLHRIPFVVSLAAIGLSAGLYFVTTLLPTLTIPKDQQYNIESRQFERLSYQFICPYKSPQAWLFYQLVYKIRQLIYKVVYSPPAHWYLYYIFAFIFFPHNKFPALDWPSFDLRVLREYDQHVTAYGKSLFSLQLYQIRAFEWAVEMFRDSPMMTPHLQNVVGTIPSSVAIPAVLGRWDLALWTDTMKVDVDLADRVFRGQHPFLGHLSGLRSIPNRICQPEGIRSLFHYQLLMTEEYREDLGSFQADLERMGLQKANYHFIIPLAVANRFWTHQNPSIQKRGLSLLRDYEESWRSCSSFGDHTPHNLERLNFAEALAFYISHADRTSILVTSKRGQEFVRFIHHEIIAQKIYQEFFFSDVEWLQAIEKIREVGNLPSDYFTPLPKADSPPPDLLPLPPIRYSLDTQPDEEFDHSNEVPGSEYEEEPSNSEKVLDIRTVGDPTTTENRKVEDAGNPSVRGRGHTISPEGDGSPAQAETQADERGLVTGVGDQDQDTPNRVLLETVGSPGWSIEADGHKQALGTAKAGGSDDSNTSQTRAPSKEHTKSLDAMEETPVHLVGVQGFVTTSNREHAEDNPGVMQPQRQVSDNRPTEPPPATEEVSDPLPNSQEPEDNVAPTIPEASLPPHSEEVEGVEQR